MSRSMFVRSCSLRSSARIQWCNPSTQSPRQVGPTGIPRASQGGRLASQQMFVILEKNLTSIFGGVRGARAAQKNRRVDYLIRDMKMFSRYPVPGKRWVDPSRLWTRREEGVRGLEIMTKREGGAKLRSPASRHEKIIKARLSFPS